MWCLRRKEKGMAKKRVDGDALAAEAVMVAITAFEDFCGKNPVPYLKAVQYLHQAITEQLKDMEEGD
jgi:hypothetical protein